MNPNTQKAETTPDHDHKVELVAGPLCGRDNILMRAGHDTILLQHKFGVAAYRYEKPGVALYLGESIAE